MTYLTRDNNQTGGIDIVSISDYGAMIRNKNKVALHALLDHNSVITIDGSTYCWDCGKVIG